MNPVSGGMIRSKQGLMKILENIQSENVKFFHFKIKYVQLTFSRVSDLNFCKIFAHSFVV